MLGEKENLLSIEIIDQLIINTQVRLKGLYKNEDPKPSRNHWNLLTANKVRNIKNTKIRK